jgi:hypothetical protein
MHKIFTLFLFSLSGLSLFAGSELVQVSFEEQSTPYITSLEGAHHSSLKPYSGSFHLEADIDQFKMAMQLPYTAANSSGYVFSCYVDPKGTEKELSILFGGKTYHAKIEENVIGYRQVIIPIPANGAVIPEILLTITGSGKKVLIDDILVNTSGFNVPDKPQSTQIISNYKVTGSDMIASLKVNGEEINTGLGISADGYSLINKVVTIPNGEELFSLSLHPSDHTTTYGYGVWADENGDGVFGAQETVLLSKVTGSAEIVLPAILFKDRTIPLRIRLLDERAFVAMSPYNGSAWGQTIDLLILSANDTATDCSCSSPDYFMDLCGKKMNSLDEVPFGIYFKACGSCFEKIIVTK